MAVSTRVSIQMAGWIVIAIAIYLFILFLAFFMHVALGLDYVELEMGFGREKQIAQVDVATYLVIGAMQLIFFIAIKGMILIALLLMWVFNFVIIGNEYYTATSVREINPFALFKLLGIVGFRIPAPIHPSLVGQLEKGLNLVYGIFIGSFATILGIPADLMENVWEAIS